MGGLLTDGQHTHMENVKTVYPATIFSGVQRSFNRKFSVYMYDSLHMTVTAFDFSQKSYAWFKEENILNGYLLAFVHCSCRYWD